MTPKHVGYIVKCEVGLEGKNAQKRKMKCVANSVII